MQACSICLAALLLHACSAGEPREYRLQRAIVPSRGGVSTADLPRVEIGNESRFVLGSQPTFVLRWREEVELSGDLAFETPLPDEVGDGAVRIKAWASVREAEPVADAELLDATNWLQMRTGGRAVLAAPPQVVRREGPAGGVATSRIQVPAGLRGRQGLLYAVARPVPAPLLSWEAGPFAVAPGAKLRFGYGVEKAGWDAGAPAVRFRVSALEGGSRDLLFEDRIDPARDAADRHWFDASVDLAAFSDRSLRFVFEAQALTDAGDAAQMGSFAVVSSPEVYVARAAPEAPRRNLILISLDTLRARSVSAYGNERETTPALDRRIAAAGALVRSAVAPYPFTPPSHMTMLTGLEPCAHRVLDRHGVLAPGRATLAEIMRAAGYRTAAFTENAYVVAAAGFARGFDVYVEQRSDESASPGFIAETFAAAERWLDHFSGAPSFLFLHTYQVHEPYAPPPGYRTLFSEEISGDHSPELAAALVNYEREIRYTDDVVGRFLDALDARGLSQQTIVVVTSDHGEGFGEHFWGGHGFFLHDEALLVPLLVRAPGLVPAGRVVEEQVGLVDLMPTLLDLLGIPLPADVQSALQGRSFASLLTGRGAAFAERPLVARATGKQIDAVRSRDYKYLRYGPPSEREVLYDLRADPREKRNVAADRPALLSEARHFLATHETACKAWRQAHPADPARSGPRVEDQPGWFINRDEIDAKLRSLGYIE